jgi:hypothetical protein
MKFSLAQPFKKFTVLGTPNSTYKQYDMFDYRFNPWR